MCQMQNATLVGSGSGSLDTPQFSMRPFNEMLAESCSITQHQSWNKSISV